MAKTNSQNKKQKHDLALYGLQETHLDPKTQSFKHKRMKKYVPLK